MKYPKGTFTQIQLKAVEDLPSKAQLLFVWLNYYADSKGTCFPSLKTLSNKSKMSVSSVNRNLKILINTNILQKTNSKSDSEIKLNSNLYQIKSIGHSEPSIVHSEQGGVSERTKGVVHSEQGGSSGRTTNYNQLTTSNITKSNELAKKQNNDFFKGFTDKGMEAEKVQKIIKEISPLPETIKDTISTELANFCDYWTEQTYNGQQQKWETQKTFEVKKRLATWLRRSEGYRSKNAKPAWKKEQEEAQEAMQRQINNYH